MTASVSRRDVDSYGFRRPKDFDYNMYDGFMGEYLGIMARRAAKWNAIVGKNGTVTKSRKVKRFCRKGVPSALRPQVWLCLSGAAERMENNPHLYQQMLTVDHSQDLKDTINMDLHRTFPDNMHFTDEKDSRCLRKPLYNILLAISHRNSTMGYCQGMNYIVGLMLLIMKDEDKCEEKVFWLMDTLINNILPDYYNPDMHAVKVDQEVLGQLVSWKDGDVSVQLEQLGLSWCLIGMKWFICLYADVLPVDTVLRIWDCLFCEGAKVLHRAALVLVLKNKEKIRWCTNFSDITDLFKNVLTSSESFHCHTFLQNMFGGIGSLPMAKINQLRRECSSKV